MRRHNDGEEFPIFTVSAHRSNAMTRALIMALGLMSQPLKRGCFTVDGFTSETLRKTNRGGKGEDTWLAASCPVRLTYTPCFEPRGEHAKRRPFRLQRSLERWQQHQRNPNWQAERRVSDLSRKLGPRSRQVRLRLSDDPRDGVSISKREVHMVLDTGNVEGNLYHRIEHCGDHLLVVVDEDRLSQLATGQDLSAIIEAQDAIALCLAQIITGRHPMPRPKRVVSTRPVLERKVMRRHGGRQDPVKVAVTA